MAGVNCFRLKFYAHLGIQSVKNAWLVLRYLHGRALSVRGDPRCSIIQFKEGAYFGSTLFLLKEGGFFLAGRLR